VPTAVVLRVVLVALLLSGCSGTATPGGSAPETSAVKPQNAAAVVSPSPHASSGSAAPVSIAEPGVRLEALLGQHSILAADMMRARIRQDADLAQSADSALGKNTAAMADLLQPVIGKAARDEFADRWAEHITELFNYARGLATDDDEVRREAHEELVEYEGDLAEFFAGQSQGRLDRAGALAAVQMHVDHLVEGADAYAAKDYATAAKLYRQSYAHSFEIGSALAHALLPAKVTKELDTPELRLRSALTQSLGEHVALVVAAMRSAVGEQSDFSAMGTALNGNTVDLTAAMDTLFGAAAAKGFQSRWSDHVDQLMAYTAATVKGDGAEQEQARETLRTFEQSLGTFLNTATENRLGQSALAQTYAMHDRMLMAEIDAYAAKNYQEAQDLSYQTYEEMFTVSALLAGAIGDTLGPRLPRGGSQTGGGALAGVLEGR
jgi:hypothetical protein